MLLIISFLYLMSPICSIKSAKSRNKTPESRNLQYSMGSIYYELEFPINNLTGTGDRLKDVPYMVQCKIMACSTGCCVGQIDKMSCGPEADCLIYLDSSKKGMTIIIICVVVIFFMIFIILFLIFKKFFKFSNSAATCLSLGCISIILIPCIIFFVFKERKNVTCTDKSKEAYLFLFKFKNYY